ncbi:hypothetical protein AAFF_G00430170 [Aldrovandia affinis]|uniref:Ig-like domain-containing protein n=1 Tax=Aldrovandia affinis TaxID=143900 RepID=A0AAD7WIL2_9TELE|nr:hypothetical protein AAFF_G00430170 [Aldrovandia affinis]
MKRSSGLSAISFVLPFFLVFSCSAKFEISVPNAPLVALYGQDAVLVCTFPVGGTFDASSSVITWQRGLEVIHSFYNSQDQLDLQSRRYANRTHLDHSALGRGDASLRLDRVTLGDAGDYTCSISTPIVSQKKTFCMKVAAFYTEPHLQVTVTPQGLELKLTSRGYPTPKVRWLDSSGGEVSNETVTNLATDTQGLYVVSSSLTQERGSNSTLTFVLQNDDLQQELRREFSLQTEAAVALDVERRSGLYVILPVILLGLVLGVMLLLWLRDNFDRLKTIFSRKDKSGSIV